MQLGFEYRQTNNYVEYFFIIYFLIQPLLDIMAYFGIEISLPIRVIAMAIGFYYLLIYPNKYYKKISIIYLLIIGIFMLVNVANNYMIKDPYFFVQEFTYSIKSIYVLEMLLIYTAIFYSLRQRVNWNKIIPIVIFINLTFIGIVMLIAEITGTGNRSYETLVKQGHSGWFYSANDLSAILAIGFAVALLFIISIMKNIIKLLYLPAILLIGWSMLAVGTKVGLGALIIVLFIGIVLLGVLALSEKKQWINFFMLILIALLAIIYIPKSAIGNNMHLTFFYQDEENKADNSEDEINLNTENLTYKVLSGRELFLTNTKKDFQEAPFSQKLLGMGPGGNYEKKLKIIEMDFLDWFYGYGIVGFCLLILPLLYFGIVIIYRILKSKFKVLTIDVLMSGISLILGLGIAFFAGHILLNPASGIYFAIILAYIYAVTSRNVEIPK